MNTTRAVDGASRSSTFRFSDHYAPPLCIALACSWSGWAVTPVEMLRDRKKGVDTGWQHSIPTTDPYELDYRVGPWGPAQHVPNERRAVGIVTGAASNLWALDIDRKLHNGFHTLVDRWGVTDRPDTFIVRTKSGGEHWYFTWPADGRTVKTFAYKAGRPSLLGPGLDVRGQGGLIVAPFQHGYELVRDRLPAAAPDWLVELVVKRPYAGPDVADAVTTADAAATALEATAARLAAVTAGRNDALNHAAFGLGLLARSGLLRADDARAALFDACRANGLLTDDGEAQCAATFNSGWRAGLTSKDGE